MENELMKYLQEIADKTDLGDFLWIQINPTTYKWEQAAAPTFVTIQEAKKLKNFPRALLNSSNKPRVNIEVSYLFQVHRKGSNEPIMSLSSSERPEFNEILKRIFQGAKNNMDKSAIQALRNLLSKT